MGAESDGMSEAHENPARRVGRLEADIETTRTKLGAAIAELDRRRHEAFDLKLQLRRHLVAAAGIAFAAAGLGFGIAALLRRRSARRHAPPARLRRFSNALSRMTEHPEKVAANDPGFGRRILVGAATAAAAAAARRSVAGAFAKGRPPK